MKKIIAFQISFLVVFIPSYMFFSSPKNFLVLAKKTDATPIPTQTPSPTPSPTAIPETAFTPKPTVKPTRAPTPTPVPIAEYSSEQINGFIERFAGQYAVDPNVLRHIAICESGFNPKAVNGPYWGLYQFGEITWRNYRVKMGENPDTNLRNDAEEAVQTAAYAYSLGNGKIWPNCQP